MKTSLIRATAAIGSLSFAMALLQTSERLQFFVIATIRGIFQIHVTRWYLEALGLLVLLLLVGAIVRRLIPGQGPCSSWRQVWIWRSVVYSAGLATAAGIVEVGRRGLGLRAALFEPLWAATCVAFLACAVLVPQAVLERALAELLAHMRRGS